MSNFDLNMSRPVSQKVEFNCSLQNKDLFAQERESNSMLRGTFVHQSNKNHKGDIRFITCKLHKTVS